MDSLRKDGVVTIWQWQRKIGDSWSRIELPCTGDGYKKPVHDKRWAKVSETWQVWGVHGFLSEKDALACMSMVLAWLRKDDGTLPRPYAPGQVPRGAEYAWPAWRLAKIELSMTTSTVMTGSVMEKVPA